MNLLRNAALFLNLFFYLNTKLILTLGVPPTTSIDMFNTAYWVIKMCEIR